MTMKRNSAIEVFSILYPIEFIFTKMIETCNVGMCVIIVTFSVRCQGMCTWTVLVYSIY